MKFKLIILCLAFVFAQTITNADEVLLAKQNSIQTRIDKVATNLLNYNKVTKRIVFAYDDENKDTILKRYNDLNKRQVIIYKDIYKAVESDEELAAILAREIAYAMRSYDGHFGGLVSTIQTAVSSKKFEIVADKRAVDYMVNAKYNPLALIVYINKTCPQRRVDKVSRHNLTSRRLAIIYEYITYKYPQYLKDSIYTNNPHYQNFLLTSINNRALLKEKINSGSTKALKYE